VAPSRPLAEILIKIQHELEFLILPGERTLAQAAVQFVLRQEAVSTIIPSMDQVVEVEDLCGAADAPQITDDEIERAVNVIEQNAPVEY
jgi:aryl-alcohol dehydrogenase-like predicted oxidoreductase